MKKYVKPELFFESFELSQSIAACGIDVNYNNEHECYPELDGKFWPGLDGTQVFAADRCASDIGNFEVYCHTVGISEAGRLFNS